MTSFSQSAEQRQWATALGLDPVQIVALAPRGFIFRDPCLRWDDCECRMLMAARVGRAARLRPWTRQRM